MAVWEEWEWLMDRLVCQIPCSSRAVVMAAVDPVGLSLAMVEER